MSVKVSLIADTSVKKLNILIESNNFNTESAFLGVNENEAINNALIRYLFSVPKSIK